MFRALKKRYWRLRLLDMRSESKRAVILRPCLLQVWRFRAFIPSSLAMRQLACLHFRTSGRRIADGKLSFSFPLQCYINLTPSSATRINQALAFLHRSPAAQTGSSPSISPSQSSQIPTNVILQPCLPHHPHPPPLLPPPPRPILLGRLLPRLLRRQQQLLQHRRVL